MRWNRILQLVFCLTLFQPLTAATGQESPYKQQENIVYGEVHGVGLLMDVFTPTGDSNGLGIVDVISGAWHSDRGKIRDHARARCFDILCGKGYTVFAVRPGSISKFSAVEMLDGVNQGIRWVKHHADQYRIDPDRLGLMGASAGGHLACLAAVKAAADNSNNGAGAPTVDSTAVGAVAVFFPPTDFLDYGGKPLDVQSKEGMGALLRRLAIGPEQAQLTAEQEREAVIQISPARLVTAQCPPFLLIHGDADPVVPLQQSEAMRDALKNAGVPVDLVVKPGGGHPWLTLPQEVQVLADWFDKQLAEK